MSRLIDHFAGMRDDEILGDGWSWSRRYSARVSSDKWRMTIVGGGIEIRPTHGLRGSNFPVVVQVGEYPVLKMVVLTYTNCEGSLYKKFREGQ